MFDKNELVLNRYRIIDLLGKGGMGSVYLAEDIFWGNGQIAIKTINPEIFNKYTKEIIERFKTEYEIMTRLNHPNLIRVKTLEYDTFNKTNYIIMEYAKGYTLDHLMEEYKQIGIKKALDIIIQLLRAMDFIHSRNIVYRDLKPQNIIFNNGIVRLTDFGLSDFGSIEDKMIKGSIYYLAPEILSGSFDHRIDIYSLGILLCAMLTGRTIIRDKKLSSCINILQNKMEYNYLQTQVLEEIQDIALKEIIKKMTSYEKESRYEYCSEIIANINNRTGTIYEIENSSTREAYIHDTVFIGRQKEFRCLIKNLYNKEDNHKYIILKGSIGFGKRRLMAEFKKYCLLNKIFYYEGDCIESVKTAYYPVLQIIDQVMIRASKELILKYGEYLIKLLPYNPLLKKYFQDNPEIIYKKETLNHNIISFLTDYAISQDSITVISLFDLQWMDEMSLELLEDLQARLRHSSCDHNLRFYFTLRTDFDHSGDEIFKLNPDNFIQMKLSPFDEDDIQGFLIKTFGYGRIDEKLLCSSYKIKDKINGNPLYLKELLRKLLMDNTIEKTGNIWRLKTDIDSLILPDNFIDILKKRVENLISNSKIKKLLNIMSLTDIELDIFQLSVLMDNDDIFSLSESLKILERNEIIKIFKKKEGLFHILSNKLIGDAVKDIMEDRKFLHGYIAMKLEEIFSKQIDDHLDIIAYHYSNSDYKKKAIPFLIKSGDKARSNFRQKDAIGYYDKALSIIGDENSTYYIDCLIKRGNCLTFTGKTEEAVSIAGRALSLSIKNSDDKYTAFSRLLFAYIYRRLGEARKAIIELESIIEFFNDYEDKKYLAEAYCELGNNYYQLSDNTKALEYYNKYESISFEIDSKNHYGRAIGNIGNLYYIKGEYDKALHYYKIQKNIFEQTNNKYDYSYAVGNMGTIHYFKGNYDEAIECFMQKKKICLNLGDKRGYGNAVGNIGIFYQCKGDYNKALKYYKIQEEISNEIGDKRALANTLGNIGNIHYLHKDYDNAMNYYKKKMDISNSIGFRAGYSNAIGCIGNVYSMENKYELAMKYYEKQKKICLEIDDKKGYSYAMGNIGNIYKNTGEFQKACDYYERKLDIVKEINDFMGIIDVYSNLGQIMFENKKYHKALKYYDDVIKIAEKYQDDEILANNYQLKAELLFNMNKLKKADDYNSKALEMSKDLEDDLYFDARILKIKLKAKGNKDSAINDLLIMLDDCGSKAKEAFIQYNIYKIRFDLTFRIILKNFQYF